MNRCIPRPLLLVGIALAGWWPAGSRPGPAPDFAPLDSAIVSGLRRGIYPGAVVMVGRFDRVLHARGFGHLSPSPRSAIPDPDSTVYDLASLTKVVATSTAAMLLVDRGMLVLDAPVSRYLPEFSHPAQRAVTVRMLLNHTSGLRPYTEYFRRATTRAGTIRLLLQEVPERRPGSAAVYSDINAMLAGLVVERVTGRRLDEFVAAEIFAPLGMHHTRFLPPASWGSRMAPSWIEDGVPRSGLAQDRNARVMGGVAGHAGLFSTSADLARFAQWWLRRGRLDDGHPLVSETVMAEFLRHDAASGSRLLGWDSPDPLATAPSLFGTLAGPGTFGHTGWTGTQLWIDPGRDLFVVLLTNRSLNPDVTRSIRDLRSVRASVADAAIAAAAPPCLATREAAAPLC